MKKCFTFQAILISCAVFIAFLSPLTAETSLLNSRLKPLKNEGKYWPSSTRFLVIVHQYDGDVDWASRLNFPHIIYEKEKPEKEPFSAMNKAKGETNLLKFIAEFYDDLPENIIQVYQYEFKAYHEGSLVDILNSPSFELDYAKSITKGFWNFNTCVWREDPPIEGMIKSGWWPQTMQKTFGDIQEYGNFMWGKKACAQFVVSRERIKTLPREFYENMYFWLVENTIGENGIGFDPVHKVRNSTPLDYHVNSNYFTSRCMEKSWELIFTSLKAEEKIARPVKLGSDTNKNISRFSAKYGAKKYFRDVTSEVLSHFVKGDKLIIPSSANFNLFFTDVVYALPKTLIINIDGKEFKFEENRNQDVFIRLGSI